MKILIHQHIGKDVGELTTSIKKSEWSTYNWMRYINSDIYSIEFEFIWEDKKDFNNYWLYIWRFQRSINSHIENILKGEDIKFGQIGENNLELRLSKIENNIDNISIKLDKFLQHE